MVVPEDGDGSLHYVVSAPYVKAVRKAGAVPVLLPVVDPDDAASVLDMVDALIVTGGGDVDPTNYGAAPDPMLGPIDLVRDAADLAITRAAVDANVPTLATCRGIQVLNVAMGGTLVQHVDEHMRIDMYNEDVHAVDIDPASRLATILGTEALGVNSMHHQVIDRLGSGRARRRPQPRRPHRGDRDRRRAGRARCAVASGDAAPSQTTISSLFEDLVRQVIARRTIGCRLATCPPSLPEPFDDGRIDVGDGHVLFYEQVGNPDGTPIVYLHGGPGSGCTPGARGNFDVRRHRGSPVRSARRRAQHAARGRRRTSTGRRSTWTTTYATSSSSASTWASTDGSCSASRGVPCSA